jgi:hypothetical protein
MYFKVNGIMAMKKHIDADTCQSNSKLFGHGSNNIGNFFTNHVNVQVSMYGGMKCIEGFCV